MSVLVAQQLWKTRPVFQCLNADFYLQWKHLNLQLLSIAVLGMAPALRVETPLCCCCTCTGSPCLCLGELGAKESKNSSGWLCSWDAAGTGGSFSLQEPEHRGSRPAKHVNMSLNLGVWDVSGATCILKLNTCFTRSGQMVLHAQKWHLQGHIGNVWQSQEPKPDLSSANLVP